MTINSAADMDLTVLLTQHACRAHETDNIETHHNTPFAGADTLCACCAHFCVSVAYMIYPRMPIIQIMRLSYTIYAKKCALELHVLSLCLSFSARTRALEFQHLPPILDCDILQRLILSDSTSIRFVRWIFSVTVTLAKYARTERIFTDQCCECSAYYR